MRAHFLCTELRLLLTAYSQLTGDIMQTNIEESDVPMVQVSEHWGARESHALWQGKIFTVEQFKAVCGYGEPSNPDHIYSYNCRHTHYPYWPGISEPIAYQREIRMSFRAAERRGIFPIAVVLRVFPAPDVNVTIP